MIKCLLEIGDIYLEKISFLSNLAMPIMILIIVIYGIIQRNKVFDTFLDGAKEGMSVVVNLFPTLIGLFLAVGTLRASGVLDFLIQIISPVLDYIKIPSEIMPLALLRPISGSSSIAVAVDIMKQFGVDSGLGIIASVIMGSTETTLYTIAVYTSSVGIKKTRFVLVASLIADVVGIFVSVAVCRFLSMSFSWQNT